jgi:protein-tyrosine phosphatase
MFDSILVVCTGNICRSPIGERYLRNLLPDKKIDSAGTGALIEHAADNSAIKVAQIHGLSLEAPLQAVYIISWASIRFDISNGKIPY